MIVNLPPELKDLEIHIQDMLAKLIELEAEIKELKARLASGGL